MDNCGIIYACFGEVSQAAAEASLASIRRLGIELPAISVGTHAVKGSEFMAWRGAYPWGEHAWAGKRFRAGRVKPFLYQYSPWEFNLYLDADTLAMEDFRSGFERLQRADLAIAIDERRPLEDQYRFTKTGPEWDEARAERDATSARLGKGLHQMINTGMIFFRRSAASEWFFRQWQREWALWGGWDEQMAWLRAEQDCPEVKVKHLPGYWNEHDAQKRRIFWHQWGSARDQAGEISGLEKVFGEIYETNRWKSKESRSGRGSELDNTMEIRSWLPKLIEELGIGSILDVGCGDYHWMQHVELDELGVSYTGVDVVPALINRNIVHFERRGVRFLLADATRDALPKADLIICRDMLYHLSFENIRKAVRNMVRSGAQYLLATNQADKKCNEDIADGGYRRLNLCIEPLRFPEALRTFEDNRRSNEEMGLFGLDEMRDYAA